MQLGVLSSTIHSPAHLASHQHLSPRAFLRRPQPNRTSINKSHGASHEAATSTSSSVPPNVEEITYQIRQPIGDLASTQQAVSPVPFTAASAVTQLTSPATLGIAGALLLAGLGIKYVFDTPSRTYNQNVGQEYDAWTQEGLLEYFWGEHIHLGYYTGESTGPWLENYACRVRHYCLYLGSYICPIPIPLTFLFGIESNASSFKPWAQSCSPGFLLLVENPLEDQGIHCASQ